MRTNADYPKDKENVSNKNKMKIFFMEPESKTKKKNLII